MRAAILMLAMLLGAGPASALPIRTVACAFDNQHVLLRLYMTFESATDPVGWVEGEVTFLAKELPGFSDEFNVDRKGEVRQREVAPYHILTLSFGNVDLELLVDAQDARKDRYRIVAHLGSKVVELSGPARCGGPLLWW